MSTLGLSVSLSVRLTHTHIHTYIYSNTNIPRGTSGDTVIVVGNAHGIPDKAVCISHGANTSLSLSLYIYIYIYIVIGQNNRNT